MPAEPPNVVGVVLAAGAGRRFGKPKALAEVGGEYLLQRAVSTLREAGCWRVVAVLGARAHDVRRAAPLEGAEVVVNVQWEGGLSTSLRAGLRACAGAKAAVVSLVDQPGVTPLAVRRLIENWRDGDRPVAVATYRGAQRNPVLFDASVFAEVIAAVHGDVGAKPWLQANPSRVSAVEVADVADDADVDVPADLEAWAHQSPGS